MQRLGCVGKDGWSSACGWAAAAPGAPAVKAATCAYSVAMKAWSSLFVGATPAMFALHLVVAAMVATGGSYMELIDTTNLMEGDTLG